MADGRACFADVDECTVESRRRCPAAATCQNTVGSYVCRCSYGFYGDSDTCHSQSSHHHVFYCAPHNKNERPFHSLSWPFYHLIVRAEQLTAPFVSHNDLWISSSRNGRSLAIEMRIFHQIFAIFIENLIENFGENFAKFRYRRRYQTISATWMANRIPRYVRIR